MMINISGTNGSGKSTVIRSLLKFKQREVYESLGPKQPEAYLCAIPDVKAPVWVIGPYRTPTGGLDQVQPFEKVLYLLEKYRSKGHVVFEGVIASGAFGRVQKIMEQEGKNSVVILLTTSLEDCIKNTQSRRSEKGNEKPFNPKNLSTKYKSLEVARKRIINDNIMTVLDLSSQESIERIPQLLRDAK